MTATHLDYVDRYEVVETDGANAMHDTSRPFAVRLVQRSGRTTVLSRHATRKQANAAAWRRRNSTPVR
jgi:hypothetical protein